MKKHPRRPKTESGQQSHILTCHLKKVATNNTRDPPVLVHHCSELSEKRYAWEDTTHPRVQVQDHLQGAPSLDRINQDISQIFPSESSMANTEKCNDMDAHGLQLL
jgi:hypothetical protein